MTALETAEPVRRPVILVVEDQTIVAMDIERSLRTLGYEVLGRSTSANDAIRQAHSGKPDLILMDIRLPGQMDGVEAAKVIREELQIPVIFLTAFSDPETLGRAKVTEPFGYIVKPFTEADLRCAIEIALHRCRSETTVRHRERLFETTLRSIGDGVVTTNPTGEITFLNRAAEELTGWTNADAAGRQLASVLRLEDELTARPVEVPLRQAMDQAVVTYLQPGAILLAKNGERIPIEDSAAAIVDDDASRLGGVVVFRDGTTRRIAEEEIARLAARYRCLFESAEDGIWILSTEGTLLEINRRAEETHGSARGSMLGRHFSEFVSSASVEAERARFVEMLRAGSMRIEGVEIVLPGGRTRLVDLSASVVTVGDETVVVSIERDVTEKTRTAEQVRQYQRMEAIGQLTGGVAHDFNNILSVILSYSGFLSESLGKDDPRREDAEEIRRAGERGATLTRQLLAFSRQQVLEPKTLNLNVVLSDMEKMLRRLLGEDIDLTFRPAEDLQSVRADRGQIEQVVLNLAINARDAMPKGGKLRIETANVDLDGDYASSHVDAKPGPHVMFAVSDTGVGMDRETVRRAFEPFFTTKERGKGTGLGLATCHGIVKQSGGHLAIYSERGRGTAVRVYLPCVRGRADADLPRTPIPGLDGHETILVIEDDEAVRSAVARILKERGYQVLLASDGADAIALSKAHTGPIHLILSDTVLPGLSSIEVIKALQEQRAEVRVLFMSGYTHHALLGDGVFHDGLSFIQKPFGREALEAKVRHVLDA